MVYGVVSVGSVNFGSAILTEQNGNVAIKKNDTYEKVISVDENIENGILSWDSTTKSVEVVQIGGGGGIVSDTVDPNDANSVSSRAVHSYVNSSGYIDSALKSSTADDYFTSSGYQELVSSGIVQEALNDEGTIDALFTSLLSDLQSEQYMLQTVTSGSGQHTVSSSGIYSYVNSSGYIDSALKSSTADDYFTSSGYQELVSSGIVQEALNDEGTIDALFTSLLSDLQSEQYMLQTVTSGSGQHTVSSSGIYDAIHSKIEFTQGIVIHSARDVSLDDTTLSVDMSNTSYLTAKLSFDVSSSGGNVDNIQITNMSSGSTFVIAVEVTGTGTNTLSFDIPNMTAFIYDGDTSTQITKFKKTQNTAIAMESGDIMLLSGIMIEDILFMTINDNDAWY